MRSLPSVWCALRCIVVLAASLVVSGCGTTRAPLTTSSLAALRIPLPEASAIATRPWASAAVLARTSAVAPATFETPAANTRGDLAPERPEPRVDSAAPIDSDGSSGQRGVASYYASSLHGRTTASGEPYDETALSAAHRTLPFGSRVRVTNLANDRHLVLTVTDRGPFVRGRVIDVSREAARRLGFLGRGTVPVEVAVVGR